jgi:hypothetical protein
MLSNISEINENEGNKEEEEEGNNKIENSSLDEDVEL